MKKLHIISLFLLLACSLQLSANPKPGNGWTVTPIADGITYYTFSGIDEVSGVAQQVFIVDLDLCNPKYAFRFTYSDPVAITSDVFARNNAIVAMNATYEPTSVAIKVNGTMYHNMAKNTVFDEPVPNWKSEAAIYTDGFRDVRISFDGKGKSIKEQRSFYAAQPDLNIFTSAPMLVDDFDPVGARFVDPSLTPDDLKQLHYESPARHQGVRHPRAAVAKTSDDHLILLAVDGRRAGIGEGMTAKELTLFLVKWFNPQYALNMDGGGSTSMAVRGQGDPNTHIVNYPTDNKRKYDHAGERSVPTHFIIVELPQAQEEPSKLRENIREEIRSNPALANGEDLVYDLSPKASAKAPKGYEPIFIEHYGRHGSRYAYTAKTYTLPLEMLRAGAKSGNLTAYGEKLYKQLDAFWQKAQYQVGDLTPLGWKQHQEIARTMVKSFPGAFGKGSSVDACSSASVRSILSMSACCASIAREAPKADVYEHQGILDIQATRPNMGKNPFRYKGPDTMFPYRESPEQFFTRRFKGVNDVLGRLFKDPVAGLGKRNAYETFFYLYMFVAGMNSLPEEERMDVGGIFTPEEFATIWEIDNYERFREYLPYRTSCSSIVDDMIAKADERLVSRKRGADLRFGHDHVVLSLLMIMDLEGFGFIPAKADDLAKSFQSFRSPMAANIQFVFYAPKKGKAGDVLVKVLLNGEEAQLGNLKPADGPYYEWTAVKDYLAKRTSLFVTR